MIFKGKGYDYSTQFSPKMCSDNIKKIDQNNNNIKIEKIN